MTTPSAVSIARQTGAMVELGTSHVVVEVSSHALAQQRCAGVKFAAAAVTNITRDHLDYHSSITEYRAAKARIAEHIEPTAPLLINADDNGSHLTFENSRFPTSTFGTANSDVSAEVLTRTHRSQRIRLRLKSGEVTVRLKLIGSHNVSNALVAAAMAEQIGISLPDIRSGLEALKCVPGRLERVDAGQPFQVLVDYAHTPDALDLAIRTIRLFAPGRLICVFGAGGNRDTEKRPLMGQAASQADLSIVTSDNPRNECPQKIADQITSGFQAGSQWDIQLDRREAITQAFALAEPGDVVLLAGKGHEVTQQESTGEAEFDDRQVARSELARITHADPSAWQPVFASDAQRGA